MSRLIYGDALNDAGLAVDWTCPHFASTFALKLSGNKRGATGTFYPAESGTQAMVGTLSNFNIGHSDSASDTYEPSFEPAMAKVTIKHDPTPSRVFQEIEV